MKPQLLPLRKTPIQTAFIVYLLIIGLVFMPYEWLGNLFFQDELLVSIFGLGGVRLVSGIFLIFLSWHLGLLKELLPKNRKGIFFALPAFLIAVNNLPIIALASGEAKVLYGIGYIVVFAFECVGVGFFEEVAFRGIIFPLLWGKTGKSTKGKIVAIFGSAALFGMLHAVNFLYGFSATVILQMGYSFLIGMLLAAAMTLGAGALFCAGVHSVYNFCGMLISRLGTGVVWSMSQIILTVIVAVAVAVYFLYMVIFYEKRKNRNGNSL